MSTQRPIQTPLTSINTIKAPVEEHKAALQQVLKEEWDAALKALEDNGTVHFARFVFFDDKFAIITTYDGSFETYMQFFMKSLTSLFMKLGAHLEGSVAPPKDPNDPEEMARFAREFTAGVRSTDYPPEIGFYSAYPTLGVQQIRGNAAKAATGE